MTRHGLFVVTFQCQSVGNFETCHQVPEQVINNSYIREVHSLPVVLVFGFWGDLETTEVKRTGKLEKEGKEIKTWALCFVKIYHFSYENKAQNLIS